MEGIRINTQTTEKGKLSKDIVDISCSEKYVISTVSLDREINFIIIRELTI